MEGGEEDPFGSLIKFCQPTSSQELKFQSCPFAREDETFPDALDSLGSSFSPSQTQSQPPGIVMVSLPDSEDDELPIDENAPTENEEFQTPPEDHHPSSSSSQGDPRRTPTLAVDERVDMERVTVDDGCRDEELGVENLKLSKSVEMEGGGDHGALEADCVQRDDEVAAELKKFGVYDDESEEPALKKIRVSAEDGDSMAIASAVVDDDYDEFINSDLDIEEGDEEIVPNEDIILIDVDSTEEESEDDNHDEVSKNGGKGCPDGKSNKELEDEMFKFGRSHGNVSKPREEEGVRLDNGGRSVLRNGYLALKESEQELRNNRGKVLGENGKEVSDCMNREDIDLFNYYGCGSDNGDHRWKEVVRRKRELPLSMREKGNDMGKKEKISNLDVKNLSWKELLDASAILLKKVDHASKDVDFLETAERRGMSFPQPRWI